MSTESKLRFTTVALRRELPSEHHEVSPVVMPTLVAYGAGERPAQELALALSELAEEGRPASVARYLLPEGVRVEEIEVEVQRTTVSSRFARPITIAICVVVVPEPRPGATPAGHWVFVPAIDHACYVTRTEDLATRVQEELAVLPTALDLNADGWKRLLTWTPAQLERIEVELATTPFVVAQGRKAMADAEKKRLALATLDAAGRRVEPVAEPLVGRADVLAELARVLTGRARKSVLLVGEEAAGKSALAHAFAVTHPDRKMWATSAAELVAGASGFGEWQARIAGVLDAAEALDAILYFDDFGALFSERVAEGGVDLGGAMRRHVVDGRVRVLGELTAPALDRAERRDVSLIGAMLRIAVPPTDPATTIAAARQWAAHWRETQAARPQIDPAAIPAAVDLAKRYLPYRAFPGKAIRLLEELRVAHDAGRSAEGQGKLLGESELYTAFAWSSGIPVALLADDRALAQTEVIAALRRRMIGQDQAVRRVADAIAVAKARLQPADKPLAALLFVGPSGVGKTELARSVASYLFGASDRMVRLDMSEYTDPWAAERLFGGASGDDGRLTAAVRSQPFGVVLLDEIEKAHSSVFDLLLQVLGEARLTDGRGRTTYFHNSIIVLTSNLGTRSARGKLGLAPAESDEAREERRYRDAVMAAFRPELINRLDQIVVFHPLREDEIAKVAEIAVTRLAERRGLTQSGVLLDVSPVALARIAELGFSPDLGARALRRHIDAAILAPAARLMAKAGADGKGGTLTVRGASELVIRPLGQRLGEEVGPVTVALWRRPATTGKRLVRSAMAIGELRRETDRELALPAAVAVRDKIAELESTLATAAKKDATGKPALSGKEIARLAADHARLVDRWTACATAQAELRTAEELCLEALARDIDAVDLIDSGIAQRERFRRELFWLLVSLYPPATGAMLLVHSPDSRPAVVTYAMLLLEAAAHLRMRGFVHLWGEEAKDWSHPWGPPHDLEWATEHLAARSPAAVLIRIGGAGADRLFGLEQGLHRFHAPPSAPVHVHVDILDSVIELHPREWAVLPGPPTPRPPRGTPMRDAVLTGETLQVEGDEIDLPYRQLAARLPEAAVVRLLAALAKENGVDDLWDWDDPCADVREQMAAEKAAAEKSR